MRTKDDTRRREGGADGKTFILWHSLFNPFTAVLYDLNMVSELMWFGFPPPQAVQALANNGGPL